MHLHLSASPTTTERTWAVKGDLWDSYGRTHRLYDHKTLIKKKMQRGLQPAASLHEG